jgi:hypothetical protein
MACNDMTRFSLPDWPLLRRLASGLKWAFRLLALVAGVGHLTVVAVQGQTSAATGELLPTGARITPEAADGAIFQLLNPDLPIDPTSWRVRR